MRLLTSVAAASVALLLPAAALAATYQVGPSRTYKTLGAVAGMLNPGDLVEVDGDATYPAVNFTRNGSAAAKITVRGIKVSAKRPVISGGTNSIEAAGDHYVFEGLDITGGSSRCFFHHADDITLRDSVVHDCPKQGILGADNDSGSLLLEYTEVHHAGGGTFDHQIYMATDESTHPGAVFRMQYCYVHDANGGNSVKSRSERNEIYYNWIEGALYHELELIGPDPAGGVGASLKREDSDVVGNVLKKTRDFAFVRIGGDGTGETRGRYRFVNNTFVGAFDGNTVFRIFDGIESVEMHNNVFYRMGGGSYRIKRTVEADWVAGEQIAGSNNWIMTGSAEVPTQWTGTLNGTDPGFSNASANDFRLTAGSPLVDKGATTTSGPAGYAFPSPLARPLFEPPSRALIAVGSATARATAGAIDIGAYELGSTGPAPDAGTTTDSGVSDASSDDTSVPATDSGAPSATDSGTTTSDAFVAPDDGTDPALGPPSDDSGSCGCEVPGSSSASAVPAGLALAVLLARRRRLSR